VVIQQGATYELRSRWFRRDEEVGPGEQKGEGKKRYTQHTFVDRGYLVLRLTPLCLSGTGQATPGSPAVDAANRRRGRQGHAA
jgi:hypothetical protein